MTNIESLAQASANGRNEMGSVKGNALAQRRMWLAGLAVTLPIVAGTIIVLVFAFLENRGRTPFSYDRPRNIAEAAGMGSGAEVLRLLREGHDPRAVFDVRPEIISTAITRATALEAAIWSRRVQLVYLLDRHGAITSLDERRYLYCVAQDIRADDVQKYLGTAGANGCEPGQAVGRIAARSRSGRIEARSR